MTITDGRHMVGRCAHSLVVLVACVYSYCACCKLAVRERGCELAPRPPRRRACRFMAFDRHMNLVLGDAEEYRTLPPKKGRSEEDVRRPPGPRLPEPALRPRKLHPGPQLACWPLFACLDCARRQQTRQRTALRPRAAAGALLRRAARRASC